MHRFVQILFLCLVATPLLAQEEFEDGPTGLKVLIPEGWDHNTREEKGSVRFAATFDVAKRQYVLFRIEASPGSGFEGDAWLQAESKTMEGHFKKVTAPFKRLPGVRVGGIEGAAYEVAGTVEPDGGEPYPLHVRTVGLVKGDVFFKISQTSFNDAHLDKDCAPALEAMWSAITFGAAKGILGADGEGAAIAPPEGEAVTVEDKAGNYKVVLPPGWVVAREAPDDGDSVLRLVFERQASNGATLIQVQVLRYLGTNPSLFSSETPGSILKMLQKENDLMDNWYGEGAGRALQPHVDEGVGFGGADKAGGYEYRSHKMSEIEEIREAETQVRRGVPGATVPDIKPLVIRGRIALISPHIYLVQAEFNRGVSDDPELLAEFRKVMDGVEFLATKPKPPPATIGNLRIENTKDDPAYAEERDEETLYVEKARKEHKLEVKFTVPPGFQFVKDAVGGNVSAILAAQDKDNNWVTIMVYHASAMAAGEQNKVLSPPKQRFEEWKHNWTSKAKGARMRDKPETVNFGGGFTGKGYELAEGTVENFPATFTGCLKDSSGWRTVVEMETMGKGHEVFADGIKAFFKSLKMKKVK